MAEPRHPGWLVPTLRVIALSAGALATAVAVLVLVSSVQLTAADPLGSPALKALKQRVGTDGADAALFQDIRNLDLLARRVYFSTRDQMTSGVVLMVVAYGLCFGLLQLARTLAVTRGSVPRRPGAAQRDAADRRFRRVSLVVGIGLALACGLSLVLVPSEAWEPGGLPPQATSPGASDDGQGQWGRFRGPRAGVVPEGDLTAAWAQGPAKVLWQAPLDTPGLGSPVVWDTFVFLNAAADDRQLVQAWDTRDGKLLWTADLGMLVAKPLRKPEVSPDSSLATPTMACDARSEFVVFPTGRLACLDRRGALVWSRELGLPENSYGLASSLLVHRGMVIVQFDQTEKSVLAAFDALTGTPRWETVRDSEASWSSPIVVPGPQGDRIVVAGNPNLAAFNPTDGALVWQFPLLGGEVAPSPAWSADAVFVANQYALAAAVPLAGAEAGSPATLWETYDDLPDIGSPVAGAGALYFCTSRGKVTSLDAVTGTVRWQAETGQEVHASPLLWGPRLLVVTTLGRLMAFDAARGGQPVWQVTLPPGVEATPAWHDGRLFVRTEKALVALGAP